MSTMADRYFHRLVVGAAIAFCAATSALARSIEAAPAQTGLSLIFDDPGTTGNWHDRWFEDGRGDIRYTADGMVVDATSGHTVLWAKPIVAGDVRIEYDYTHLDSSRKPYVVIIFIQAKGAASHPADISTWQRPVARYPIYHDEMDNYSITYDNSSGSLRARHNAGFKELGTYRYTAMFERNETYHITVEKSEFNLSLTAENIRTGAPRKFSFVAARASPLVDRGRIGLRQMVGRISRYKNFKIWATQYVGGGGNVGDPGASGGTKR